MLRHRFALWLTLFVVGASSFAWAESPAPAADTAARTYTARQLEIVDDEGRPRVRLLAANGPVTVVLLDARGRERVQILDANEHARPAEARKHRRFWDDPSWRPATW